MLMNRRHVRRNKGCYIGSLVALGHRTDANNTGQFNFHLDGTVQIRVPEKPYS